MSLQINPYSKFIKNNLYALVMMISAVLLVWILLRPITYQLLAFSSPSSKGWAEFVLFPHQIIIGLSMVLVYRFFSYIGHFAALGVCCMYILFLGINTLDFSWESKLLSLIHFLELLIIFKVRKERLVRDNYWVDTLLFTLFLGWFFFVKNFV